MGQMSCIYHNKELDVYCKTHQGLNCEKCLSTPSKDHKVCDLPVKPVKGTASFTSNQNHPCHMELASGGVIISGQGHASTDQDWSITSGQGHNTCTDQGWSVSTVDNQGHPYDQNSGDDTVLSVSTVLEEWKPPKWDIQSLVATAGGQAWTSGFHETATLYNRKGTVIMNVKNNEWINDISVSPTTQTLWFSDHGRNIKELVSGQCITRFLTPQMAHCLCVTTSDHVLVGMAEHISKYTTQGQMVLTTMATGKPLVSTPHKISECPSTHNVAVCDLMDERNRGDGNQHVLVMDANFQELFIYRPRDDTTNSGPFVATGAVYDSVGNLIIADFNNYRVLLLSGDGQSLRILHTDSDWTWAIGVDGEDILWVVIAAATVKCLQYGSV